MLLSARADWRSMQGVSASRWTSPPCLRATTATKIHPRSANSPAHARRNASMIRRSVSNRPRLSDRFATTSSSCRSRHLASHDVVATRQAHAVRLLRVELALKRIPGQQGDVIAQRDRPIIETVGRSRAGCTGGRQVAPPRTSRTFSRRSISCVRRYLTLKAMQTFGILMRAEVCSICSWVTTT